MAASNNVPLVESAVEGENDISGVEWERTESHDSHPLDLTKKAEEFFLICDRECKGFINKRDLEHLQAELPLSSEELEDVFDALDADGNGKLTMEEFTDGFSQFLLKEKLVVKKANPDQSQSERRIHWDRSDKQLAVMDNDEEHCFHLLMDNLGAKNLLKDQEEVQSLWARLRKEEPQLLSNFEAFLVKVSIQMQEASKEKEIMEGVLKRKETEYLEEINNLYDETEQQIQREKERMFSQVSNLSFQNQELEEVLKIKEEKEEQISRSHKRLEKEFGEMLSEKQELKMENQRLKGTTKELEKALQKASSELLGAQHQMQALHQEMSQLQEEQERELYRVTEGLEREKIGLHKQLDLLREMNKHLREECNKSNFQQPSKYGASTAEKRGAAGVESKPSLNRKGLNREELGNSKPFSKNLEPVIGLSHVRNGVDMESAGGKRQYLQRIISIEEDPLPQLLEVHSMAHLQNWTEVKEEGSENQTQETPVTPSPACSPALEPAALAQDTETFSNPDRLFKLILVGNSNVGKSSILRRFCGDCFYSGICATVGIDYCVKTVNVANCLLALQLWDTAGQERFHSITKQFLRRTDGVVLIYDVTEAASFLAVRHWLQCVQEEAGADVLILLLANKTDLESDRQVSTEEGQQLAKGCNMIFYECSAFSGANITEAMMHLARCLKELEDKAKEKYVELDKDSPQQKSCCSK
ncbi:EF-hand calcium-binding domain-containing protein 4B isoform X2 [Narcine bancroftii]|uniref:EF-hand calcium-binding domain-containing protein 4B isoform X2 n=1 Tax=Narcine bancroftii TaxID=1343680 RepID=UPI003831A3FC